MGGNIVRLPKSRSRCMIFRMLVLISGETSQIEQNVQDDINQQTDTVNYEVLPDLD